MQITIESVLLQIADGHYLHVGTGQSKINISVQNLNLWDEFSYHVKREVSFSLQKWA